MQALIKEAAGPGLTLAEVPEPEPGPKEVLVRVIKAAVCGTDLHIYHWDEWARSVIEPPLVLGHEFVGEVVALGPGATLHRAGDRVSAKGTSPAACAATAAPASRTCATSPRGWASTATAPSRSWW